MINWIRKLFSPGQSNPTQPVGHRLNPHLLEVIDALDAKLGSSHQCYHDQTGAQFPGPWIVVNEIYYDTKAGTTRYATDPIEGSASPRKPRVAMRSRS